MKRIVAFLISIVLIISFCGNIPFVAAEAGAPSLIDNEPDVSKQAASAIPDIAVPLGTVKADAESDITYPVSYGEKQDVLKWNGQSGEASFEVEVAVEGDYYLELTYMPIIATNRRIELSLKIDGEYPYNSAGSLEFPCIYKSGERKTDNLGNDMVPRSEKQEMWWSLCFADPEGLSDTPLLVHLEKGKHTITLKADMAAFYISDITLTAPKALVSYEEYKGSLEKEGIKDNSAQEIIVQGEDVVYKSDSSIIPSSDRSSAATMPISPVVDKLNMIALSKAGQWLEWEFDVKESGFYKLGFRFLQDSLRGFSVTRQIYIDGSIPFAEFSKIGFEYKNNWQYKDLEDYPVYLEKGPHSVRVQVVLGDFSKTIKELSEVVKEMNSLYRKIIMITSTSPDSYRDYRLENQIVGFTDTLFSLSERLNKCGAELDKISGKSGGESAFLYEIADQLESIGENPETMASRLDRFSSNISSLSSWINDKKTQPLTIDYLRFSSAEADALKAEAGFFKQLWYRIKFVACSFVKDYTTVGNVYEDGENKTLEVWMTGGSEYAKVAKSAIDELFVDKTGINVNLRLVQVSIIIATFAGNGPDVSLNVDPVTIVNLAARGELVALSDKEGFDDSIKDFYPESLTSLKHNGKCYGLPITQNFSMMFYRTDIFEELGLTPPETWQEFEETVAQLQTKNMQVGISDLFTTHLMQKGIDVYNEDLSQTNFDKPEAVEAFEHSMQYFTHTGLPDVFDFYNRFRSGEMPLGIQDISQYNMLSAAAPEIKGLWEMVPIPGTEAEDGSIICTEPGSASTAAILFKKAKDNPGAWEFIRWWAGAEAQSRYGNDLEMILGTAARYMAANKQAVRALPWSNKELGNIFAQWDQVKGIPTIPASYYLNRGLTNAFRNVLYNNENPREALFYQNKQINKEIARKRKELNLD